ncbi:helix-turn-helix transcriptional regulator [Deinococcus wulumuqiensis]|uniref:Repressor n=1 Tax=Deinococcus wulumuqiensis TaxID=980427 RepID=A0AAV4K648_9DEIO|nr:YafY family protein [Deinococcus wulumuqiensis]QII21264.1 YafY family transcriptional regulator [Deinococcus wulumuqiensis R12]GGI69818.1 repressor [Deinococcus wulumuqiensis]GGI79231.1 repressor [Deinococcus wulumuqiensis]
MTYDPSLRVLTVLELLQAREEVTGAELARRLEVSPRTVQRYVMKLQDLGIPVEGKRGVGGAYRLKPGFRLPPLMFTGEEALSLALGLRALRQLGLHTLAPAAEAASAKLTRTLPHSLREEVQALEKAVQLDDSPWVVSTDAATLATLLRAVRASQVAEFAYTSNQGAVTRRQVNVYRVMHVDGRWYAVGWCQLRQEVRSFRLDRIRELAVLEETFTPPQDFDALAYIRSHACHAPSYEVSVWLAAPPATLRGAVSVWHTDLRAEGEGTRLTCQRENLASFAAFLLGVGVDFRVDSPPELREVFRTLTRRCAAAGAYTDSD